jgi:hypothetical protein
VRYAGEQDCFCMGTILLPAQRHCKSSRGTPRLRCAPQQQQGAPRLAGLATNLDSSSFLPATAASACGVPTLFLNPGPRFRGLPASSTKFQLVCHIFRSSTSIPFKSPRIIRTLRCLPDQVSSAALALRLAFSRRFAGLKSIAARPLRGCSIHADRRTSCWRSEGRFSDA